jgi:hypothetical protein
MGHPGWWDLGLRVEIDTTGSLCFCLFLWLEMFGETFSS